MSRKVECEVSATEVEIDDRTLDGVEVECGRCGHIEEAAGTTERSVKRCLAMLRENCPNGESNFYVADED